MDDNRLIKEFKEISKEDICFDSASKYFKSVRELYKPFQNGTASSDNFFDSTVALFNEIKKPNRKADFVSESGSRYWFKKEGLVRGSNHWGNRVVNCDWAIKMLNGRTVYGESSYAAKSFSKEYFGFVKWEDIVLKPEIVKIGKKEVLLSFENKIGRDIVVLNKKKYQRVITVSYKEVK